MKFLNLLIAIFFCFSASVATAASNLVSNPGFETGGYWGVSGSAGVVYGNAHSGSYSMRATSGNNGAWQQISVTPNTSYTLTAWGKKDSTLGYLEIFVKNYGGAE